MAALDFAAPATPRIASWLAGLPDDVREAVASKCTYMRCRKGHPVVERDDDSRQVFFVVSGHVRVVALAPDGRESSYRDIAAGGSFGELSALDGLPRSATVLALDDAVLACLTAEAYADVLQSNWALCRQVMLQLVAGVRELTQRLYELDHLSVRQRLASELLRVARDAGQLPPDELTAWRAAGECTTVGGRAPRGVALPSLPTHEQLAGRIGASRSQVTRELAGLRIEGLLDQRGQRWSIADLYGLQDLVLKARAG